MMGQNGGKLSAKTVVVSFRTWMNQEAADAQGYYRTAFGLKAVEQ